MQKGTYRLLVFAIFCVLFGAGSLIGFGLSNNLNSDIPNNENEEVVATINPNEEKISEVKKVAISIIRQYEYSECGHIIESTDSVIEENVEVAKSKIDKDFIVISNGINGIVARKTIDGYCPNHFSIEAKGKYVVVYRLISSDEKEIYKTTDVVLENLREELIDEIKKGIKVDSLEELNTFLEDIES